MSLEELRKSKKMQLSQIYHKGKIKLITKDGVFVEVDRTYGKDIGFVPLHLLSPFYKLNSTHSLFKLYKNMKITLIGTEKISHHKNPFNHKQLNNVKVYKPKDPIYPEIDINNYSIVKFMKKGDKISLLEGKIVEMTDQYYIVSIKGYFLEIYLERNNELIFRDLKTSDYVFFSLNKIKEKNGKNYLYGKVLSKIN